MKLLVLGGTKFLGRAVADAALGRGHELTLFNRGLTHPELFPEAEHLRGDRDSDLTALSGRTWDAVVDPSGYVPRVVRASARLLADAAAHYVFVSSISVYADFGGPLTEASATAQLGEHSAEELRDDYANYGALKVLCEDEVRQAFGDRHTSVRSGLIVGPHDPTGRFTYWPHRVARGGDVLAPGPRERKVQFVDVRDLGSWLVDLCESRESGAMNATNTGIAWSELLERCRVVTGSDSRFVWVTDEFLNEHDVGEWMELPLWLAGPESVGMHLADASRALAAGLAFRPLDETIRGTLDLAQPVSPVGLTSEREAALLQAWRASN